MTIPSFKTTSRLAAESYLRSTFVLGIDLIVSMLASGIVVLFADLLGLSHRAPIGVFVLVWMLAALAGSILGFLTSRSYEGIIRHSTLRELSTLMEASVEKELIIYAAAAIFLLPDITYPVFWILPVIDLLITLSFLVLVRITMVLAYDFLKDLGRGNEASDDINTPTRVLIYGLGDKSISLATRFSYSEQYEIVGYLTRSDNSHAHQLNGKPIYRFSDLESLVRIKDRAEIEGIMFPTPTYVKHEGNGLVEFGRHINLRLYVAPSIDEVTDEADLRSGMRTIRIEDLLGRDEIEISLEEVKKEVAGKTVLVTGAAGSIGSELSRQLAKLGAAKLILFDNAETPLHYLRLEFEDKFRWVKSIPIIGDVRQIERVDFVFRKFRPDMVFHAAAYKHVPLMEENPCEAVLVNVSGSRNIADKCVEYEVGKMVMVSTDKAVNPTNIMGCTKRLAEIYVQSLGLAVERGEIKGKTRFITTRFGNVLGSNGSVIPRFKEQIEAGGPVTVTHPEIRRFFMTIPEACRLVMEAAILADSTLIYAFDMGQPVKIAALAARMIHLAGFEVDRDIKIVYSGLRPGEKLYEEVLADKENTIPTSHQRIFQAKVREYDYTETRQLVNRLEKLAQTVEVMEMVKLMKQAVPEFISKHSEFEQLDHEK